MPAMQPITKYYFSTEGETEKWYLEHLERLINVNSKKVVFSIKVTSPMRFIKRISILNPITVYHFFDVESLEQEHSTKFQNTLDEMQKSKKQGKSVNYQSCYSNLTFEVWMILHKTECNSSIADRKNYLSFINKVYNQKYQGLKEYKEEKHFKAILKTITLDDVKNAVDRADKIMKENELRGYKQQKYQGYSWYEENPSTEVGNVIKKILQTCDLM